MLKKKDLVRGFKTGKLQGLYCAPNRGIIEPVVGGN